MEYLSLLEVRTVLASGFLLLAIGVPALGGSDLLGESIDVEDADVATVSYPQVEGEAGVVVRDTSHNAFGRALANLDPADWPAMREGKRIFVRRWRPSGQGARVLQGLGPLFNGDSCTTCHFKDGRGGPPQTSQAPPLIFRLDPRQTDDGRNWGEQLQDRAFRRQPEGQVTVEYQQLERRFADGERYFLRQPYYQVVGVRPAPALSPRIPPTLVGVGLLEAVAEGTILEWADPDDLDGDGISGRPRWVDGDQRQQIGRFGWKAAQASLPQQVANALAQDMGLTSALRPEASTGKAEVNAEDFEALLHYLRSLAPPAQRALPVAELRHGSELFQEVGCESCHRRSLSTAEQVQGPGALAEQTIHPYTDLLLHDLGAALADDNIHETGVSRSEWRTAPLWGLGLLKTVNGKLFLLHDGRAKTFEEAILWHGGEAKVARQRFSLLSPTDRKALVKFVESL